MRIIELSNHPGAMLQHAQQRRRTSEEQVWRQYENERALHTQYLQETRKQARRARAEGRWLAWLVGSLKGWVNKRKVPLPPQGTGLVSDREQALAAGMSGEQAAAIELGRDLGDEWTMIRGYRNRRGEIDQLLLGPRGLFAIEVKYRNATVHSDGDDWWYEKYDNYGNFVDQGWLTDRRGRSPSQQLNEPADELAGFLRKRGQRIEIERMILFNHAKSQLGRNANLTVNVSTWTGGIIDMLNRSQYTLSAERTAKIEQLILRDHRFHENRRKNR